MSLSTKQLRNIGTEVHVQAPNCLYTAFKGCSDSLVVEMELIVEIGLIKS